MRKSLVTLQDVADAAGVSKATAARILGDYGTASASARASVRASAQALGYQPNEIARSMATGRSGTIGVIVGDIENPFFGQAVRGIGDVAKTAGFDVLLVNSGENVAKEQDAVRVLVGKRVDGLIVALASRSNTGHLSQVRRSGRPLVLMDRVAARLNVDSVVADDREAAAAATRLLIGAGHRRIAYVTATDADDPVYRGSHQIRLSTVMNRIDGFREASIAAGLPHPDRYIRLAAARQGASNAIITDLLSTPPCPTAVLASDNMIALDVFKAIRALNMTVPGDVSLVAFHDADWTSVTSPPLTVVRQPVQEIGRESASLLVQRINGVSGPVKRLVLATNLVERESVTAPRQPPDGRRP